RHGDSRGGPVGLGAIFRSARSRVGDLADGRVHLGRLSFAEDVAHAALGRARSVTANLSGTPTRQGCAATRRRNKCMTIPANAKDHAARAMKTNTRGISNR